MAYIIFFSFITKSNKCQEIQSEDLLWKRTKVHKTPIPTPQKLPKKHSHIAICFSATRHRQERHIKCSFSVLSQKQPGLVYSSKWRTHWRLFLSQYFTNILLFLVLPNTPPLTLFAHLSQLTLYGIPWSFLNGVSFKTSLAAGWEPSRGGRSSPTQVAACCASRSPGSLENRTSAAKHGKKERGTKREYVIAQAAPGASGGGGGLELIWVARWLLDWICRKGTGFSKQGIFVFTLPNTPSRRTSTGCILLEGTSNLCKTTRSKHRGVTGCKGTNHPGGKWEI